MQDSGIVIREQLGRTVRRALVEVDAAGAAMLRDSSSGETVPAQTVPTTAFDAADGPRTGGVCGACSVRSARRTTWISTKGTFI